MHRRWPAQFVDGPTDDAASDLHRFNKESHRDGRRLPAACRQSAEQIVAHPGIEMKRLRIVAARELDDFLSRDGLTGRDEVAPDGKILKRAIHPKAVPHCRERRKV